jgi:DNA invertase Pin-like site-specific DNA recombinase
LAWIGYARVSTDGQSNEAQILELQKSGGGETWLVVRCPVE